MRYLSLIPFLALAGCNYVAEWPKTGPKVTASMRAAGTPDQVSLGSTSDDGPPKTETKQAGTTHTEKSDAEIAAELGWKIIGAGIVLILAGVGLMYARSVTAGIAIPTWTPRLVMAIGAGLIAWGSVSGATRNGIVAVIAVAGLGWMYYGSKNHNHKMMNGGGP